MQSTLINDFPGCAVAPNALNKGQQLLEEGMDTERGRVPGEKLEDFASGWTELAQREVM